MAPALDLRTLQASLPSLACLAHRVLYAHDVARQDRLFRAAGPVCPWPVPHAGVQRRGGDHLLGGQEPLSTAFVILAWQ